MFTSMLCFDERRQSGWIAGMRGTVWGSWTYSGAFERRATVEDSWSLNEDVILCRRGNKCDYLATIKNRLD